MYINTEINMKNEINGIIKDAMLSGNKIELSVFRFIKTAFTKFETAENAKELTEEEEIKILNKMVKEREDSARMYGEAGRVESMDAELAEIEVIKRFLPKEASKEEILGYLENIYTPDNKNMGAYIKQIKQKYPTANGKLVSDIVKQKIN